MSGDMPRGGGELVATTVAELKEIEERQLARESWQERAADQITALTGSGPFVLFNAVWFSVWIALNLPGMPTEFDPFPFSFLTMAVSLEAIFLSVFVLISANAQSKRADHRARVDMEINVMTEREVTKVIRLIAELTQHLGLPESDDPELREMMKKVRVGRVAEAVEAVEDSVSAHGRSS